MKQQRIYGVNLKMGYSILEIRNPKELVQL